LALAVGFTALANLLAVTALVWTEWLPSRLKWIGGAALAVIWLLAWIESRADWRRWLSEWSEDETQPAGDASQLSDEWFRDAQRAYLAGDWVLAEKTLLKLLKQEPRDAEARLLLATLWRHEGRTEAAGRELDRLERLETAAPWEYEIACERERICASCVVKLPTELSAPTAPCAEQQDTTNDTPTLRLAA
jgi:tetratricopeptide (TPR) repeat protein